MSTIGWTKGVVENKPTLKHTCPEQVQILHWRNPNDCVCCWSLTVKQTWPDVTCVCTHSSVNPQMAPFTNTRQRLWTVVAPWTSVTTWGRRSCSSTWPHTEDSPTSMGVRDRHHYVVLQYKKQYFLKKCMFSFVFSMIRTECTTHGDELSWTHPTWLPLQPVWETGTRAKPWNSTWFKVRYSP